MSIRICDVCGKPIPDDANFCVHCGAQQQETIRLTKIPETIEQLQEFCAAHHMPLEKMRFFIGTDYRGARAFGIYRDENGECVVYKNKADGSRAVRYKGTDEKRAVRELYEKLKSETDLRREQPRSAAPTRGAEPPDKTPDTAPDDAASDESVTPLQIFLGALFYFWKPILIVLAIGVAIWATGKTPDRGYYRYQDDTYYYQSFDWYRYDDALGGWEEAYDVPEELKDDYDEYYQSETFSEAYGASNFALSGYYDDDDDDDDFFDSDSSYDDYDWDSDDSWDSWDSWDSGDTDWDSDW